MDGVLADFGANIENIYKLHGEAFIGRPDKAPFAFRDLPLIEGAMDAVHALASSGLYDLHIASTASWENRTAYQDKKEWLETHFGRLFHKKFICTHRKDLLIGDYLIDDRSENGAAEFRGKWIHFGKDFKNGTPNPYPTWESVLEELLG